MRISRHQMFMEMAHVAAKRATCFRENVGCIIVKDNKVISIGYNGRPTGDPHCEYHPKGQCTKAIHAEINALNFLREEYHLLNKQCDLYVTHLPCLNCTAEILASGIIRRVFFCTMYGDSQPVYEALDRSIIALLRVMPSGAITSHDRSELYTNVRDN